MLQDSQHIVKQLLNKITVEQFLVHHQIQWHNIFAQKPQGSLGVVFLLLVVYNCLQIYTWSAVGRQSEVKSHKILNIRQKNKLYKFFILNTRTRTKKFTNKVSLQNPYKLTDAVVFVAIRTRIAIEIPRLLSILCFQFTNVTLTLKTVHSYTNIELLLFCLQLTECIFNLK